MHRKLYVKHAPPMNRAGHVVFCLRGFSVVLLKMSSRNPQVVLRYPLTLLAVIKFA